MIPFKIKIESFAKRYHMGTLGEKGLSGPGLICLEYVTELRKTIIIHICGVEIKNRIAYVQNSRI